MKTLYLAWQDPESRSWYPVGRLDLEGNDYRFVYTKGALESVNFIPFGRMTDLNSIYKSKELFPLFANRLIPQGRPEYKEFLSWVNLAEEDAEPIALLARTGGIRQTDSLLLFPCPEPNEAGNYHAHFFCQGLRHHGAPAIERVSQLSPGDPLYLMPDPQNKHDEYAVALRTDDPKTIIGYCPRFMTHDFLHVLERDHSLTVQVERVNTRAPIQFRLLCRLTATWPDDFQPCSSEFYKPLSAQIDTDLIH